MVPLPAQGEWFADLREGRALRASWHPEIDAFVLSVWREGTCAATARLSASAAASLIAVLSRGLADAADAGGTAGAVGDQQAADAG